MGGGNGEVVAAFGAQRVVGVCVVHTAVLERRMDRCVMSDDACDPLPPGRVSRAAIRAVGRAGRKRHKRACRERHGPRWVARSGRRRWLKIQTGIGRQVLTSYADAIVVPDGSVSRMRRCLDLASERTLVRPLSPQGGDVLRRRPPVRPDTPRGGCDGWGPRATPVLAFTPCHSTPKPFPAAQSAPAHRS